jgi:hypothetical protein
MQVALTLALPVLALTCASCGSGGAESGDEEAIRKMVAAAMVATGPEACLEFNTLHMLEKTTRREGEAAIEDCEEEALEPPVNEPRKMEVSRIEVEGGSATALLRFEGSLFDGQNVRFEFAEREGRWKLHDILAFVDFDRENMVMEMGRELMREVKSPREAAAGSCILELLERMDEETVEGVVLGSTFESVAELVDGCVDQTKAL